MPPRSLITVAKSWRPTRTDPYGAEKQALLRFLAEYAPSPERSVPIEKIQRRVASLGRFRRGAFQQLIVGPLRRERNIFIGTCNRGLFLVTDAAGAHETLSFYTSRLRAERWHLRNLRKLSKTFRLFQNGVKGDRKRDATYIFFDESGAPSLNDGLDYFIVAAVVIDRPALKSVRQRLDLTKQALRKPDTYEFKSTTLNKKEYLRVLRELSLVEYEWAAVCFEKRRLASEGFRHPKSFFKFAYQSLTSALLDYVWEAQLLFDQYSDSPKSTFATEFFRYLRLRHDDYPADRLQTVGMLDSKAEPLIQLADLVAGAIKATRKQEWSLLNEIEEKCLALEVFPPPL